MIRCVVFDFDGTLVLSNDIKREGFMRLARHFEQGPVLMAAILGCPSGDREAILKRFASDIGESHVAASLVTTYNHTVREQIVACPERPGAAGLLCDLRRKGMHVFVNSATPQDELRLTLEERYPAGTFDGVYGGFGRKLVNLHAIAKAADVPACDMAMIGDGTDDADAAAKFGCRFIAIADGSLDRRLPSASLLTNLTTISRLLGLEQQSLESIS